MLRELQIGNFILIESQTITFNPGFTVISGESGSGKSVVLQALEFVLGRRASTNLIRHGADALEVQALFALDAIDPALRRELPDLVAEGSDELVLSRSLTKAGKGRVYVNGKIGTVALLEEIGAVLLTIAGQREHMRLLEVGYHLNILDSFIAKPELTETYARCFAQWQQERKKLLELETQLQRVELRRAELEFIVEELGAADLAPGKRAHLEAELRGHTSAEQIKEIGAEILKEFDDEGPVSLGVRHLVGRSHDLARLDGRFEPLSRRAHALRSELLDLVAEIESMVNGADLDEERLESLRGALAEVARLERKYRLSDDALCDLLTRSRAELAALGDGAAIEGLRATVAALEEEVMQAATRLSTARKKGAASLIALLEPELRDLGMSSARIELRFEQIAPSQEGIDRVEILLSPNKGGQMLPLKQVASGGELSRFFLACKGVLGARAGAPVVVFDEVDTGISGKTARVVGEKLLSLAKQAQVICITHLPQVASLAHHLFTVEKRGEKVTSSVIREVDGDQKIDEIARMLAGYDITSASRESARELLTSK